MYRSCMSRAYFQRISFLTFVVVVLFFVEADNMHDYVSTYFVLVYRRREPVLVMKRVKRQAMFRPSWKFEGKPNSIPPQFFVLGFRVFLGGLRFRGLRFLGGLPFRGLRFLGGLPFRGLRFLGGLRFRGLRFLGGLRFRGLRFLGGLPFRGLRFLGGLPFRGLRFLGGLRFRGLRFLGGLPFRGLRFLGGLPFRGLRFLGGLPFRGLWSSVFGLRFLDTLLRGAIALIDNFLSFVVG